MNQASNENFRVLARDVAQELSADELAQVSGGVECTTTVKATYSQASGADGEVSVVCK